MTTPHPRDPATQAMGPAVTATVVTLTIALLGLGGCGVRSIMAAEETQHYDTVADAPTEGELAFRLPDVVPDDATDITVRVKTDDPSLKAYDWTSDSGRMPADCQPSDDLDVTDPFYFSGDWPDEATAPSGHLCGAGAYALTEADGRYYAWITG